MYRDIIKKALKEVTGLETVQVDVPVQESFGDYSSNVVMQMGQKLQNSKTPKLKANSNIKSKNPREVAEDIKRKLEKDTDLMEIVEKIEIAGPGFLNFWIKKDALIEQMMCLHDTEKSYGIWGSKKNGKKVVVEYSSPNIAKPFTVGHLRSTLIGDAIANLLEATGWEVYRDNHLGDWGTQFGKQIYAIKTWGNEEGLDQSDNPVQELVKLYVKFHDEAEKDPTIEDKGREWFKKLEDGDAEAKRLWKKCIDWSMKEFGEYYKLLGVSFSENDGLGYGESFMEGKMGTVVNLLKEKKLLKEGKEGAQLIFFPEDKYPPLMVIKKDGATLYATRDLAMDKWRLEYYGKDVVVINEVGAEQTLYWQQIFETEYMLEWYKPGQRVHIKHGFFRFADKKMSTRKGNVIWLKDVLDEAIHRAYKLAKTEEGMAKNEVFENIKYSDALKSHVLFPKEKMDTARQVAVGALKWNELKRDPIKDIVFDWDEILNMEGNSGPYLQYTYARMHSVLQKVPSNKKGETLQSQTLDLNSEELSVLRTLTHFTEVVSDAAKMYSPNILANYLYDLAQKFNTFYNKHRIIDGEKREAGSGKNETQNFRSILTDATATVLQNGLHLLGIETPEKM